MVQRRPIDGWLSLFVVMMGLSGLVLTVRGFAGLPWGVFGVALGLWAWHIVYAMVRVRPGAARSAVYFLTTMTLLAGVQAIDAIQGGVSVRFLGHLRDLIVSSVWLIYFNESRRVGWTFGYGKWAALQSTEGPFETERMEREPPLRLDAWDGGAIRKCRACGLGNPESAYRCRDCGQSLNGTVPLVPRDVAKSSPPVDP